jgi:hypothetical protein
LLNIGLVIHEKISTHRPFYISTDHHGLGARRGYGI